MSAGSLSHQAGTAVELGVIKEAKRLRRVRRLRLGGLALLIGACSWFLTVDEPLHPAVVRPPQGEPAVTAPSSAVALNASPLSREPYLGVACPRPNSIACDRIGLEVELRGASRRVMARIGTRWFGLDGYQGPAADPAGGHTAFMGFLHPAGLLNGPLRVVPSSHLLWYGTNPGTGALLETKVEMRVTDMHGHTRVTTATVQLRPGFG